MRAIGTTLGYWAARTGFFVLGVLPLRVGYWLTDVFALFAYLVDVKRRQRALRNVAHCFPERSARDRAAIVRACYRNLARVGFESLHAERRLAGDLTRVVEIEGREHLDPMAGGGIFMSAHAGNWEVHGVIVSRILGRLFSVAKVVEEGPFARFLRSRREVHGQQIISFRGAVDEARSLLGDGDRLAFIADQHARVSRIWVPFFGMDAAFVKTPATLARRYDVPVSIGFCHRVGSDFRFLVRMFPPIYPDPSLSAREDVARMTQQYVRYLEAWIREYPEDYLWLHQRWRAPQDGEEYIGEDGTYVRRKTFAADGSDRAEADSHPPAEESGSTQSTR